MRGVVDWLRRSHALFPLRDAVELTFPPILLAKFARYAMSREKVDASASDPNARDSRYVRLILDLARAMGRTYFRLQVRGVENVPPDGPVLLVGNHNGAFLPLDGFFAAAALMDRYGISRVPFSLGHDFLFHDARIRHYALKLGALRASHRSARRAFDLGGVVLVYPGSDYDVFRPWRDRHRIVLAGRKGFVRLALAAQVPIVPVVSVGTHEQLIVLSRGDRLAKLLNTHRWFRADVLPIVLSFPWGLTSGFFPYLPLPAQTTVAFGKAMTWPSLKPDDAKNPAIVDRVYAEVESTMQSMLDELALGRRAFRGAPANDELRNSTTARERHSATKVKPATPSGRHSREGARA